MIVMRWGLMHAFLSWTFLFVNDDHHVGLLIRFFPLGVTKFLACLLAVKKGLNLSPALLADLIRYYSSEISIEVNQVIAGYQAKLYNKKRKKINI